MNENLLENWHMDFMCFLGKKGGRRVCDRKISSYVWKNVVHGKKCVQTNNMEGSCV
jgi:hypothetical protein